MPSKEIVFQLKRRIEMPVIEDRKKFRPDEKNLPNLLIEKVGRQTVVGLDLVAIPIRDLGGRNPRRIHIKIISIDAQGSSGQAKLVLWDADATNEVEIQKIMNKSIFIESSWINWYKKEYQVRKFSSEIVLLKHTTEIYARRHSQPRDSFNCEKLAVLTPKDTFSRETLSAETISALRNFQPKG